MVNEEQKRAVLHSFICSLSVADHFYLPDEIYTIRTLLQPAPVDAYDLARIRSMTNDMETVESLLIRKGRFVGDMVHVSIKDLARCIRAATKNMGET